MNVMSPLTAISHSAPFVQEHKLLTTPTYHDNREHFSRPTLNDYIVAPHTSQLLFLKSSEHLLQSLYTELFNL